MLSLVIPAYAGIHVFELFCGWMPAFAGMTALLYRFCVTSVTNQPEVKRGLVTKEIVNDFHKKISVDTGIYNFFICWHDTYDNCDCRKPKPGLFFDAQKELKISLEDSYMIGDRDKDIIAAENAGCSGILYLHNNITTTLYKHSFTSFSKILSFIQNKK